MPGPIRRAVSFLRSRRLAVCLIGLVAIYGILGTLVPQGPLADEKVREWVAAHPAAETVAAPLGMHRAYSTPFFLGLILLLAASTTACAIERTSRATRLRRSIRANPSAVVLDRLRQRPEETIPLASSEPPAAQLSRVAATLRDNGMKVDNGDSWVTGRAGLIGLAGSPVFHWSLVVLMFVAAAGQATRAEGFLALPLEQRVAEVHENYLQIVEGPLFGERHTGLEFEMTELDRDYVKDEVDFGVSPFIKLYRDSELMTEGWVHPNSPLQVGSLMVHMVAFGPSVTLAVEATGGPEIARETFTLDISTETSSGSVAQVFDLTDNSGASGLVARVQVLTRAAADWSASESRALLETSAVGAPDFGPAVIVPEGSTLELPGGGRLRVVEVTDWARVSVANDWSVPYVYASLILATLGLAVAVLVPARRVSVLLVEEGEARFLHVGTWHEKRDPEFKRRVVGAVVAAVTEPEEE